jgi:hypothetical protein
MRDVVADHLCEDPDVLGCWITSCRRNNSTRAATGR